MSTTPAPAPASAPRPAPGAVRVAAVDCGTNSLRLLVADVDPAGRGLTDVLRRTEIVRLGQDVDRTGRFAPDALARTLATMAEYAAQARDLGAGPVRVAATSAARDAANRADLVAGVERTFGVVPEVLTGQAEAELSFAGATSALAGCHPGPFLVCDLGGGSTELVLGTTSVVAAHSMDVGSVRLTERHLAGDPPTAAELAAASADVAVALDEACRVVPIGRTATLVGVAGTVLTIAAHTRDLDSADEAALDQGVLGIDATLRSCRALVEATRAKRARLPYLHPGRVDVIGGGALVWSDVISRVRAEVARHGGRLTTLVVSRRDVLDGLALGLGRGATP